jgi:outer membrane protein OmpA-like peptidoglycan-associated protein
VAIRVKTLDVAAGQRTQFTTLIRDANRLEVEDAFFNTGSAVFLPDVPSGRQNGVPVPVPFTNPELLADLARSHERFTLRFITEPFDPDSAGDRPPRESALHVIVAALRFLERNPSHSLVAAGHTDRAGDPAFNERLSAARGRSVVALLEGKRADFVAAAKAFHAPEDDVVVLHYAARTRGWPCDPAKPDRASDNEVREFQRTLNRDFNRTTAVDGVVGDETRGAYFDLYESDLEATAGGRPALASLRGHLRFVDPAHKVLACGERFPRENPEADGLRSQQNRRVELLFFAPPRVPSLAASDAAEQIYRRKLFQFAALDRDVLAKPLVGVGDAKQPGEITLKTVANPDELLPPPLETTMPNAGVLNPGDPWAFLTPFHQFHPADHRVDPIRPPDIVIEGSTPPPLA